MIIRSQLSKKDFIKANFAIAYSNIGLRVFTGFLLLMVVLSIISLLASPIATVSTAITPLVMVFAIPLLLYFSANRNYNTAKRLSEPMEYEITGERLLVKGESFSGDYSWDKLFRVRKTKEFLFLFHSKTVASIIPLRDVNLQHLQFMKELLTINRIKNNL